METILILIVIAIVLAFALLSFIEQKEGGGTYEIIHFPITKKYSCKYNGDYLRENFSTGFIERISYSHIGGEHGARKFISKEDAIEFCRQHKEQVAPVEVEQITI